MNWFKAAALDATCRWRESACPELIFFTKKLLNRVKIVFFS
jgi:hypothetical protein